MPVHSNTGKKASGLLHVSPIVLAKPGQQILFFPACPDHDQKENHAANQQQKPVRRNQRSRQDEQPHRVVERVADPAIRAVGHQSVLSPRDDSISQIRSKAAERPGEQRDSQGAQCDARPPQPTRERQRRPGHPGRIDRVGDNPEPERESEGAQRRQDEDAFLPPIKLFPRGPGPQPMIESDNENGEKACAENGLECSFLVQRRSNSCFRRPSAPNEKNKKKISRIARLGPGVIGYVAARDERMGRKRESTHLRPSQ